MQVKTITTAAGVNEIDFGNDGSQSTAHFYWLKNLGDSALYVSANPNPIAEKDDVAELPAKGAVSVETDEGRIYVLGAGKVEIHRTNSKFCPFDWQSSGSGGGGTIDAYTKTESDAKYAQKTDIPTSLPANGGNADTVDGYHVDNLIHESASSPPKYITEFLRINDDTKSIERWSTNNLRVEFANNAVKAENADTVDGLHAEKFMRYEPDKSIVTSINDMTTVGTYGVYTVTPDFPTGYGDWGLLEVQAYGSICYQIIKFESGIIINRAKTVNQTEWTKWKEISTTPIKSAEFGMTTNDQAYLDTGLPIATTKIISVLCSTQSIVGHVWKLDGYSKWCASFYSTANVATPMPNTPVSFTIYYFEG